MIKVYGVPGWGSTISELMLTLADIPYQFVDVSGFDHEGTSRELLKTLNPLFRFRHWRWKMTRL